MQIAALDKEYFGEGLTAHGGFLYTVTWVKRTMFIFNATTLELVGRKRYSTRTGEGWGLTTDGTHLIIGDGTHILTYFAIPPRHSHHKRDDKELVKVKELAVRDARTHQPISGINELEYVSNEHSNKDDDGGSIYANLWLQDTIVKINADTGLVAYRFDVSALHARSVAPNASIDACANGIAYNSSDGTFILTGKWWPRYYVAHLDTSHYRHEVWLLLFFLACMLFIVGVQQLRGKLPALCTGEADDHAASQANAVKREGEEVEAAYGATAETTARNKNISSNRRGAYTAIPDTEDDSGIL